MEKNMFKNILVLGLIFITNGLFGAPQNSAPTVIGYFDYLTHKAGDPVRFKDVSKAQLEKIMEAPEVDKHKIMILKMSDGSKKLRFHVHCFDGYTTATDWTSSSYSIELPIDYYLTFSKIEELPFLKKTLWLNSLVFFSAYCLFWSYVQNNYEKFVKNSFIINKYSISEQRLQYFLNCKKQQLSKRFCLLDDEAKAWDLWFAQIYKYLDNADSLSENDKAIAMYNISMEQPDIFYGRTKLGFDANVLSIMKLGLSQIVLSDKNPNSKAILKTLPQEVINYVKKEFPNKKAIDALTNEKAVEFYSWICEKAANEFNKN